MIYLNCILIFYVITPFQNFHFHRLHFLHHNAQLIFLFTCDCAYIICTIDEYTAEYT